MKYKLWTECELMLLNDAKGLEMTGKDLKNLRGL